MFSLDPFPSTAPRALGVALRRFAGLVVSFATLEEVPQREGAPAPTSCDGRATVRAARPAGASPHDLARRAPLATPASCPPHPHRRPLSRPRTDRRHGSAPARSQHCLTPVGRAAGRPLRQARPNDGAPLRS